MTIVNQSMYTIAFLPPGPKAPPSLLAEGTFRFTGGLLTGWELRGFSVWDNGPNKPKSVSFPARSYMAGGVKRNWDLLRPVDQPGPNWDPEPMRQELMSLVRAAYEAQAATGVLTTHAATPTLTTAQAFQQASQDTALPTGVEDL